MLRAFKAAVTRPAENALFLGLQVKLLEKACQLFLAEASFLLEVTLNVITDLILLCFNTVDHVLEFHLAPYHLIDLILRFVLSRVHFLVNGFVVLPDDLLVYLSVLWL